MSPIKPFYYIEPGPASDRPHSWGPKVYIHLDNFVERATALEVDGTFLEDRLRAIVSVVSPELSTDIDLILNGGLLVSVSVPGNACGLDLVSTEKIPFYEPHNVDSPTQMAALLQFMFEYLELIGATLQSPK